MLVLEDRLKEWKALDDSSRMAGVCDLLADFIYVWSNAIRQELAKEYIDRAISASDRRNMADVEHCLDIAMINLARANTDLTWTQIEARLEDLRANLD